jgi:hypothetical protein
MRAWDAVPDPLAQRVFTFQNSMRNASEFRSARRSNLANASDARRLRLDVLSRNSVLCENTALPFFSSRSTSYHATRLSFPLLPDDGPICSRFLLRFENLHRPQANSRSRIWRLPCCSRRFFPGIRLLFPVPAKAKLLGCLPRSRGLFRFPVPRSCIGAGGEPWSSFNRTHFARSP